VTAQTYVGRYPPFYYLLVGWPSLLSDGIRGFYLMRLASAACSALMLGLAAFVVCRWSTRQNVGLGLIAAASPMTLYLGAMVNPNGLEITAAICLAIASLVLLAEQREACPPSLVAIATLAAVVLTLMRAISPLWTVLIFLVAVSAASWGVAWRLVRRARKLWWALGSVTLSIVLAAAWSFGDHAFDLVPSRVQIKPSASNAHVLGLSIHSIPTWFPQMVGIFGWLDTSAPAWTIDVWYAVWAFIVAAALIAGSWRSRALIVLTTAGALTLCAILQYSQARRVGVAWQGRNLLPLASGVIILAAWSIRTTRLPTLAAVYLRVIPAAGLCVAYVGALFQTVRRYSVGFEGSLMLNGRWQPPSGAWLVVSLAALGAAVLTLAAVRQTRAPLRTAPSFESREVLEGLGPYGRGVGSVVPRTGSPGVASGYVRTNPS
jgi:hypothetical protein